MNTSLFALGSVMLAGFGLGALLLQNTLPAKSALEVFDYGSVEYRPINYLPGDILTEGHHAFLKFTHPSYMPGVEQFLNVRVVNPENGNSAWLVKNLLLAGENDPRPMHYRMHMNTLTEGPLSPPIVQMEVAVGEFRLDPTFVPDTVLILEGQVIDHFVPSGENSVHYPGTIPLFAPLTAAIIQPDTLRYLHRGCVVPNIDLDSLTNQDSNPDDDVNDSDLNACGPAAAANSMKWLMETHPEIPDTAELRFLLDTLKHLMDKDDEGVKWFNIVKGKLHLIDIYNLPIRVKYQTHTPSDTVWPEIPSPNSEYGHKATNRTGSSGIPDFDWICSELEAGEDVELHVNYWCKDTTSTDDTLVFKSGHFINLTGYASYGNERKLSWKHDIWQETPGGTIEESGCWGQARKPNAGPEDTTLYPVLTEMSETDNGCVAYVGSVISESYDPDIDFCGGWINSDGDSGEGSARDLIACSGNGKVLMVSPDLAGDTITLTSGEITINKDLTITANPSDNIFVAADNIDRIFRIDSAATVHIYGLNMIGGTQEGTAILNNGSLHLDKLDIFLGQALSTQKAVVNQGTLVIDGETVLRE